MGSQVPIKKGLTRVPEFTNNGPTANNSKGLPAQSYAYAIDQHRSNGFDNDKRIQIDDWYGLP